MKNILKFIPVMFLFACTPRHSGDTKELIDKRDSLQKAVLNNEFQINRLNKQIAMVDTSYTIDELKLIKKIAFRKNRVVTMNKKIRELENELKSLHKEIKYTKVKVKELKGETFEHYINVFGNVEAVQYAQVSPEMSGQIRSIHVKAGERVKKGQLLVTLNTDAIESQIQALETSYNLTKITFERQDELWRQGIGSEIEYLSAKSAKESMEAQLKAMKAQEEMSQIIAPFDGIVDKIFQKEGTLASSMMPVLEMVNLNSLQIKAAISEKYIGKVTTGQWVELSFPYVSDTFTTPIMRTSKVINDKSRTFEIEVRLNNPGEKIKPNMVSGIRIKDYSADDALVVPSLVISKDIEGDYVYIVNEKTNQTVVEKRYITAYIDTYKDQTQIINGLKKGDKVIVDGYHLVSSGIPVQVVE